MKSLVFLYSALFLGLVPCSGQNKQEDLSDSEKDAALLWKITGKDLKDTSYIFGTIHLICSDEYLWTPAMQKALGHSKKIAFELDMDNPTLQNRVSSGMLLHDGKTLEDFFSKEDYKKLSDFSYDSLGLSIKLFQSMKPFAVLSLLSMKAISCTTSVSYEEKITELASVSNKEIVGLETAEDQLRIFDEMNKDSTVKQLMHFVENWDSLKIQYEEMVKKFRNQDLAGLYQAILSAPDIKDNLNTLLFDRNQKWIPEIENLINHQSTFIAVGAGHLWGDKGVLNLLREQGYTLTPIH